MTARLFPAAIANFIPRSIFPTLTTSVPRSYFLGHHKAGLDKMKTLLGQIDLVLECRDYRIPLTSRNPLLEDGLKGTERMIVYTKHDLGFEPGRSNATAALDATIRRWHAPTPVHFSSTTSTPHSPSGTTTPAILAALTHFARTHFSLTGHRVLVAGMPNVGKSTLLNALRLAGVGRRKAARTGAQPGVTRRIGSFVKIVEGEVVRPGGEEGGAKAEGVYVLDSPGVFMPYVPHAESMLKLALCGTVKDGVVPPVALADYLLFRLNLEVGPGVYGEYTEGKPTNEVMELLEGIARRTGRLGRGGVVDVEGAAVWLVQRWRAGFMGRFVLDEVYDEGLERAKEEEGERGPSVSQARKMDREARREKMREKGLKLRGQDG